MPKVRWIHEDAHGVEHEIVLPGKWEICDTCRGNGSHSLALGAITEEDRERDWSQDEWEDYMAGGYDRQCAECGGTGKIVVVDASACITEGRQADLAGYEQHLREEAEWAREERVTAYWESGGAYGSRY